MEKTRKRARGMISVVLAACLLFALCAPVLAHTFNERFYPPFPGSLKKTGLQWDTTSPYVQHSAYTTKTTYALQVPKDGENISPTYDPLVVTSSLSFSDTVRHSFTYKSGYGGLGQKYYMIMYPSYTDFSAYTAAGSWSP